jgi:hypothetical protein
MSESDVSVAADVITIALLAILRVGTLGLGAAETFGSSSFTHPAVVTVTLAALAGQTAVTFGFGLSRLTRRQNPVLGDGVALTETVAGVAALVTVAYATPPMLRTTSTYWVEPYTVVSALVLAATARRVLLGAAGATCLCVAYLVSVLAIAQGGMAMTSAARATAWTNALSYLPFFAVGALGFSLLRSVVNQTEALRRLLARLSAERARVLAAGSAYRIGHDIPKALLREVRRNVMAAERLRPLAAKYRDDLLDALSGGERQSVDLREELAALTTAFSAAMPLRVDLNRFEGAPAGAPCLLIVEAARELLNNASYHAFGYSTTLTARSSDELVELTVHDDGPGVDPQALSSAWARKQNTVHQLEAAGGGYRITSSPSSSAGTTIVLEWPALAAAARGKSAPSTPAGD